MKNWLKILLVIFTFAIISVTIYLILHFTGYTNINKLQELITNTQPYGLIVYCLIFIAALILLCFIPLLNTSLIILGIVLFNPLDTFIVCMISNFLSSTTLFFIGDKLGEGFARKLIGTNNLEKTQNLIDGKSKILLPLIFILPGFPDEALCLVAGMTKIKYWYLITVSLIYHAFEIGLFCFLGSGLINWTSLSIIDWFLLINILVLDIYFLFKLEKYLRNRKNNNKN